MLAGVLGAFQPVSPLTTCSEQPPTRAGRLIHPSVPRPVMAEHFLEGAKNELSPAVTVTTVVLILTFVVGFAYRLFVTFA